MLMRSSSEHSSVRILKRNLFNLIGSRSYSFEYKNLYPPTNNTAHNTANPTGNTNSSRHTPLLPATKSFIVVRLLAGHIWNVLDMPSSSSTVWILSTQWFLQSRCFRTMRNQ